jgi:hypothetical protein
MWCESRPDLSHERRGGAPAVAVASREPLLGATSSLCPWPTSYVLWWIPLVRRRIYTSRQQRTAVQWEETERGMQPVALLLRLLTSTWKVL